MRVPRRLAAIAGLALGLLVAAGPVSWLSAQESTQESTQESVRESTSGVLTLREAVARSLEENQALETARWQLRGAQAQAREAWGNVMPQVNVNASYTRNLDIPVNYLPAIIFDPTAGEDDLIGVQFGSDNQWYAQARATQPLFDGAAFVGVGAAARFEALQQEVLRGQAQQVVTETRLRYYDVLLADEQLRLTSKSVARVAQVLDETRKRNQAGLASNYEVLRLEVELANLEPNEARARNAAAAARRALAVTMGEETLGGVELAGSLLAVDLPALPGREPIPVAGPVTNLMFERGLVAESLEAPEALDIALDRRSELRQLRLTRDLRRTERRAELSQYLPQVSLFGTWTAVGQGNDAPTFFGDQNFTAKAVGVEVSVPLFSGLQRPARVSRLSAVVEQASAQLELAEDRAENEVRTLLDQVREAYDRVAAQQRAVTQATRGFDIARQEYGAGIVSQLQVADAELALRQSEFNYAQSVYDYLTAQARLDAAIGVVPGVEAGDTGALQENAGRP